MKLTKSLIVMAAALLTAGFVAGCECMKCCGGGEKAPAEIQKVEIDALAGMVATPGKVTLVDARKWKPGMEYIPGSVNVADEHSDAEIAKALPDKTAEIVTYCANPRCTASPMLAKRLQKLGYTNVKEFPGGIAGWKAAGKPVETAK